MTESLPETIARLVAARAPRKSQRVGVVWRVDLSPETGSEVVRELALEVREGTLDRVLNLSRAGRLVGDLHDAGDDRLIGRVAGGELVDVIGIKAEELVA